MTRPVWQGTGLADGEVARIDAVCDALLEVEGVVALGLGGSRARGVPRADSDVDLVLFYREDRPLDVAALRALAAGLDDGPSPIVTEPWEWGRWVNGGAWLRCGGRRVDWLYRSLDHCERTWQDARAARVEIDWLQQPPFGFASLTLLAEQQACRALADDEAVIASFARRISVYPEALRRHLLQAWTWQADFALRQGRSFEDAGHALAAQACALRSLWFQAQVWHAHARRYPPGDKQLLASAQDCPEAPDDIAARMNAAARAEQPLDAASSLLDALCNALGNSYEAPGFPH